MAVLCETHWKDLLQPSWGREMDLQRSRQHVVQYWTGTLLQHQQENSLYRHMHVGAAQRELSRDQGARFLSPGCSLVTYQDWTRRFSTTVLPVLTHFWGKARDHHWWLGKMYAHPKTAAHYVVRFLDDPGPVKLKLFPSRYTTTSGAERDMLCLQTRQGRTLRQGILRNINESRGVELADPVAAN